MRYTGREPWPDGDDPTSMAKAAVMAWRREQTDGRFAEDDDRLVNWIVATFTDGPDDK